MAFEGTSSPDDLPPRLAAGAGVSTLVAEEDSAILGTSETYVEADGLEQGQEEDSATASVEGSVDDIVQKTAAIRGASNEDLALTIAHQQLNSSPKVLQTLAWALGVVASGLRNVTGRSSGDGSGNKING